MTQLGNHELWRLDAASRKTKDPCWKGYKQVGWKRKNGKKVPNCVPIGSTKKEDEMDTIEARLDAWTLAEELFDGVEVDSSMSTDEIHRATLDALYPDLDIPDEAVPGMIAMLKQDANPLRDAFGRFASKGGGGKKKGSGRGGKKGGSKKGVSKKAAVGAAIAAGAAGLVGGAALTAKRKKEPSKEEIAAAEAELDEFLKENKKIEPHNAENVETIDPNSEEFVRRRGTEKDVEDHRRRKKQNSGFHNKEDAMDTIEARLDAWTLAEELFDGVEVDSSMSTDEIHRATLDALYPDLDIPDEAVPGMIAMLKQDAQARDKSGRFASKVGGAAKSVAKAFDPGRKMSKSNAKAARKGNLAGAAITAGLIAGGGALALQGNSARKEREKMSDDEKKRNAKKANLRALGVNLDEEDGINNSYTQPLAYHL